jgi:cytochrome c peroxidase
MRLFLAVILTAISFATFADIDQKLSQYVEKFNLEPLAKPQNVNPKLAQLGHELFEDPLLSGNRNITCRDCHHPRAMTADELPLSLGEGAEGIQAAGRLRVQKNGKILARNTPSLFNLDGVNTMFWDGRVSFNPLTKELTTPVPLRADVAATLRSALAAQAIFPIVDHAEMRGQPGTNEIANAASDQEAWDLVMKRVLAVPEYRALFAELYPGQAINIGHVGEAIAEFQRAAFAFSDTPYDAYLRGDRSALTEIQKVGMDVFFGKGKCGECHNGAHLSNFEFHSIGVPQIGPGKVDGDDRGRNQWDRGTGTLYAFRVPALRNVALTAPYMHNGTFKTLAQVVEHYDMIVESLTGFKLVNNWKNYVERVADHDHRNDDLRTAALSAKLTPKLFFEEEEEKALAEFLTSALTDRRLAAREIDGTYETYFRLQLRPGGFEKLDQRFAGVRDRETFYYFDSLLEGGFFLRELAQPIRLILVKKSTGTELVFREQLHKTAVADAGVVFGGAFNRDEKRVVPEPLFRSIEAAYLDLFDRIYAYNDGTRNDPLPVTELAIIRSDVAAINYGFHRISFAGAERISDVLNRPKNEVVYVPTSFNTKETNTFTLSVDGKPIKCILQRSILRTETGAVETTWAIEFETGKVLKSEAQKFGKSLLRKLDLAASDVGGGTPSSARSALTRRKSRAVRRRGREGGYGRPSAPRTARGW